MARKKRDPQATPATATPSPVNDPEIANFERRRSLAQALSAERHESPQDPPDVGPQGVTTALASDEQAMADKEASYLAKKPRKRRGGPIVEPHLEVAPVNPRVPSTPEPDDDDVYRRWLEVGPKTVGRWLHERMKAGVHPLERLAGRDPRAFDKALKRAHRELPVDIDPHRLDQSGWTIVCAKSRQKMLRERLRPLLEAREKQTGRKIKPLVYERHDTATLLLSRYGETPGTIDPKRVPYYLLIVGDPEEIPFEVQYGLSLNHAVGRLCFEDPADYTSYAEKLVQTENEGSDRPRRATLVSVEHKGDEALELMTGHLVRPLLRNLTGYVPGWQIEAQRGRLATKKQVGELFGGPLTPALLLFSGHGAELEHGARDQRSRQGALRCQRARPDDNNRTFAAADLFDGAELRGNVSFLFACYGAGTPRHDNFPALVSPQRAEPAALTEHPFVARLPQAMLARGASAVVGHVDRGWMLSFVWSMGGRELSAVASLEDSLKRFLLGDRLGHALRPLQRRAGNLAAQLSQAHDWVRRGFKVDLEHLGELWLAYHDARNFITLGDPAAYLLGKPPTGKLIRLSEEIVERVRELAGRDGMQLERWIDTLLREQLKDRELK